MTAVADRQVARRGLGRDGREVRLGTGGVQELPGGIGHVPIRRAGRRSRDRVRKQVVEPVFGQIKQARGFRQFLLRGLQNVRAGWAMLCTAHNCSNCTGHPITPACDFQR